MEINNIIINNALMGGGDTFFLSLKRGPFSCPLNFCVVTGMKNHTQMVFLGQDRLDNAFQVFQRGSEYGCRSFYQGLAFFS